MNRLSRYFVNGLIVIAPIATTLFIINQFFSLAEKLLGRHLPIRFPGLSLLVALTIILLVGWLSSNILLKKIISYSERLVNTIPIIKFIYSSVKQLSSAVFETHSMFKQAVLVNYPTAECKALGFIMANLSEPIIEKFTEEHVCVFVPFSLNMTAGVNIIVPKRDIIFLDITNESALQYIITAGSIMPHKKH